MAKQGYQSIAPPQRSIISVLRNWYHKCLFPGYWKIAASLAFHSEISGTLSKLLAHGGINKCIFLPAICIDVRPICLEFVTEFHGGHVISRSWNMNALSDHKRHFCEEKCVTPRDSSKEIPYKSSGKCSNSYPKVDNRDKGL